LREPKKIRAKAQGTRRVFKTSFDAAEKKAGCLEGRLMLQPWRRHVHRLGRASGTYCADHRSKNTPDRGMDDVLRIVGMG